MADREPVQAVADGSQDLYDIATWERRTPLDRVSAAVYRLVRVTSRVAVVAVALLILLGIGGLSAFTDPQIGILTALSALPAFGLALYVYYSDTTSAEPLTTLVATFLLGILTATFAAVVNTLLGPLFGPFGAIGMVVFFVVVGPVEETMKLLAGVLGVPPLVGFLGFVVVYDGVRGLYLLGKVGRYSATFHRPQRAEEGVADGSDPDPDAAERE